MKFELIARNHDRGRDASPGRPVAREQTPLCRRDFIQRRKVSSRECEREMKRVKPAADPDPAD
jgi:hypothetical protein